MNSVLRNLTFAAFLVASALINVEPALADNRAVESRILAFGDLSMFYQAMVNTGMINELREDQHYTIFAPTNAALQEIRPDIYPCFYSAECRPQIAAFLRNHVIAGGGYTLAMLSDRGGLKTTGVQLARVEEPYVGDYTVNGVKILSRSEVDGNVIYRIDGVLADRKDMAQFQTVSYAPPANLVTQKTIKTYSAPVDAPDEVTETTTIIRSTTVAP